MEVAQPGDRLSKGSLISLKLSIIASISVLLLLLALHFLSPEFDPSWRMVSEYANGKYGWVLSLMFLAWALSSWLLAYGMRPLLSQKSGRVGWVFLIAAGVGEAMAAVFDIKHSLHSVSAFIGIGSLAAAAILISRNLKSVAEWQPYKKIVHWSSHMTWMSIVLMAATFIVLMVTYAQTGLEATGEVTELPEGVIALVGWANRFLVFVYCVWAVTLSWLALKLYSPQ